MSFFELTEFAKMTRTIIENEVNSIRQGKKFKSKFLIVKIANECGIQLECFMVTASIVSLICESATNQLVMHQLCCKNCTSTNAMSSALYLI